MSDDQFIGRYRIIERLGQGGFASVYRAENTSLGIEVALKIMDPSLARDHQFLNRFRQEARETARLDHPNIVRVLDLNQVDNQLFIAMEYVPGRDLGSWLANKEQLPALEQVAGIVSQIASALDYAHQHGLVHRDIKPHNILIRPDGSVKLVDFGIVKAAEGTRLTKTGTLIGTPAYMSPEQIKGQEVGPGSDIYSLGIVTYELVTGRIPFDGDTASLGYKHVHEPPPLPSSITPRGGGSIEPVLLRALEKSPGDRYETAGAFAQVLKEAVATWQSAALQEHYDQAQQYLAVRNYSAALPVLESLNELAPGYQDVDELLVQVRSGLKLEQLYQEAGEHLQSARELAHQVQAEDPEFPDNQLVFQTLQSAPNPYEMATVVERGVVDNSQSQDVQSVERVRPVFPVTTAVRWAGLALAFFSFFGYWEVSNLSVNLSVWGVNVLFQESLYPYVFIPLVVVVGYLILLLLQHFVPHLAILWRLMRWGLAWTGGIAVLITLFTIFEDRSTGPVVAAFGLFFAGFSDLLALILKRGEA